MERRNKIKVGGFVSKVSKMGITRKINVPAVLHKYFPVGTEVEVFMINNRGK